MITVNRENILSKLEVLSAGLCTRNHAPQQSECIVLENNIMFSYNDEIAVRSPSGLGKKLICAVKAKPLIALLQKKQEDEVSLELIDNQLIIKGKRSKTELSVETEISLGIDTVGMPEKWNTLSEEFSEAIDLVGHCTEKEKKDSQFNQVCIHIHPDWVEAHGKNQLGRYTFTTGVKQPILIRQASLKHILAFNMTEFGLTDAWIHFRNASKLMFSFRRFLTDDFPYPDMSKYLKVEGKKVKLPKALIQQAAEAGIFAAEDGENEKVYFKLMPGKIRIQGIGISGKHTGWVTVTYNGEPRLFAMPPKLMTEIASKYNDVILGDKCLKVQGGKKFEYIAAYSRVEKKDD